MEAWGVLALLAAVAVSGVCSDQDVAFPEDLFESSSSRIVSGWEAVDGQLPFQISLRMVNSAGAVSSCGGSIISANWGLTAAHCTASRVTLVIRAGVVNLTRPAEIFETTKYYNHPSFNDLTPGVVQPNDIGILEFGRSLTFSNLLQPIRVQRSKSRGFDYEGVQLIASGWGWNWTQGSSPENLNWVYLSGESSSTCQALYSSVVSESTICARYYNVSSQSTCQGDSGGPLTVVDDDGAISLVGVTSFVSSTGCHTPLPAGFIQPGYYHDWYKNVTGVDFDWLTVEEEEDDGCDDDDDDEECDDDDEEED